jgi:hypothetical protein
MTTRGRYWALTWFSHHQEDPASVLLGDRPTVKMSRLMAREGQLLKLPTGWILTPAGRDVLDKRPKRRRRHDQPIQRDCHA